MVFKQDGDLPRSGLPLGFISKPTKRGFPQNKTPESGDSQISYLGCPEQQLHSLTAACMLFTENRSIEHAQDEEMPEFFADLEEHEQIAAETIGKAGVLCARAETHAHKVCLKLGRRCHMSWCTSPRDFMSGISKQGGNPEKFCLHDSPP